jgi:hypothetical protein
MTGAGKAARFVGCSAFPYSVCIGVRLKTRCTGSFGSRRRSNRSAEATAEVVARTAVEPHLRAVPARNDAEAVVLNLMQPLAAGRQLISFGRKARRDEAGREGTLQHVG